MLNSLKIWLKIRYHSIVNSISFYPSLIGIFYLVVAILMLGFDFSLEGKNLKSNLHWLKIRDASTARAIISAIASGTISLSVFSFSMVMIVLNQAASQMSNRVLDKLIGNRFQQIVLGIYIGTIVYALFLLSTIRDIDSGLYIPSLSIYLLIILTIFDIFLFIYFLHYITQSVKYEVIIRRIYDSTLKSMKEGCFQTNESLSEVLIVYSQIIYTQKSGVYQGLDKKGIINFCEENDCLISITPIPGTALLIGIPLAKINKVLNKDLIEKLLQHFFIQESESIEENYFYGFRQLTEIAIKALSQGINDPATAIISLRSLFELYSFRILNFPINIMKNSKLQARVILNQISFDQIFLDTIIPIWNYGKEDRMIRQQLLLLLPQLITIHPNLLVSKLLDEVKNCSSKNEFTL